MAVLKLSPAYMPNNATGIHLGTVRTPKPITESVTILQAGMPPLPNLALPDQFAPCDWADIVLTIVGAKGATKPVLPLTLAGFPAFPYPPPPMNILMFPAWSPVNTGVTIAPTPRLVGLPLPGVPWSGIPPGVLDCLSLPGSSYEIQFSIAPHAGQHGLKRWELPIRANNATIAKVILSANFINPNTPQSR